MKENEFNEMLKQTEEIQRDIEMARKWSRQAVILSVAALIINVLRVILKIIGVL